MIATIQRATIGTTILALFAGSLCSVVCAESSAQTPTQVSLTWLSIFTLAASTGILTALLNLVANFLKDRRAAKQEAGSLALRLINQLETFAIACGQDLAKTHYDSDISGLEFLLTKVPPLPPLREPGDNGQWAAIDKHLSTLAATMNYERDHASQSVKIAAELVHQECTVEEVFQTFYKQATNIGLRAALLAQKLRQK